MEKIEIIKKIKDLLRLAGSQNDNEASTAKSLAEKLIAKHSIKDSDLEDKNIFEDKSILFSCEGIIAWKMALASALSDYFYCSLVQLQSTDQFGKIMNDYFLYGEDEDIKMCQAWFEDFHFRLNQLIEQHTDMKDENYKFSFSQGIADGVQRLLNETFIEFKRKSKEETKDGVIHISNKEIKKPSNINEVTSSKQEMNGQKILNPYAYYGGLKIGLSLSLPKTLDEKNA